MANRKGPGMFKLQKLAFDYLSIDDSQNFHEAMFDVEILQKLVTFVGKEDELINKMKIYDFYLENELQFESIKKNLEELALLKNVISKELLKKLLNKILVIMLLKKLLQFFLLH